MRGPILFLACLTGAIAAMGQSYPLGLNPSSIKWQQINTDKVQIVFPEDADREGQRVANLIHFLNDNDPYPLGEKHRKISIILHNRTVTPNGFVALSPYRSELYIHGPMQNFTGITDWLDLLTIHEYRHVQQFNNAYRGITRVASWLFGQNGWGVASGLALPRWFFEGDAVFYETTMTNSGRGRMPDFENQYKALLLSDTKLGYEKVSATSLKTFIPSHYTLGYYMTTGVRREQDQHVWSDVLKGATRYKGLIFPFSKSLKRKTGMRTPQYFKSNIDQLRTDWNTEITNKSLTSSVKLNSTRKKAFTSYYNPTFLTDDLIVAEKRGFRDVAAYYFVDIRTGKEEKLTEPGFFSRGNRTISRHGDWMVWAQDAFDIRWDNREYSVIMAFNTATGTKRQLTRKTRYFAPAFSPSGDKLAVVFMDEQRNHQLRILAFEDGSELNVLDNDKGYSITFPTWISDNELAAIVKLNDQNALARIDPATGAVTVITPFWPDQLSFLTYGNGMLFVNGVFTGTDEIYALRLDDNAMFRVTSTAFGAIQADISPDGSNLVYSEYTADGYDLKMTELDAGKWTSFSASTQNTLDYFEPAMAGYNPLAGVPSAEYDIKPYRELSGFQLHSWTPWALPPSHGIDVFAENKLSTISTTGTFRYNTNESTFSYGVSAEYGKFFPVFSAGFQAGKRDRYVPIYDEEEDENNIFPVLSLFSQQWKENKLEAGITLPLNLTTGNVFSWLWLSTTYQYLSVDYDRSELGTNENFGAMKYELDLNILRRRVIQHQQPRLGFTLQARFNHTLITETNKSHYFQVNSRLLLPGFFRTHSFYINTAYKREPFNSPYKFIDEFFYARGYNTVTHDEIYKTGFNYQLPLWYPDLAVGPLLFFQRINLNLFYDFSEFRINSHNFESFRALTGPSRGVEGRFPFGTSIFSSTGAELTVNMRVARSLDANVGVRYSRLLDDQDIDRNQFDFIIISIEN